MATVQPVSKISITVKLTQHAPGGIIGVGLAS